MMRRWLLIALVFFVSLTLQACGGQRDVYDSAGLAYVQDEKHLRSLLSTNDGWRLRDLFSIGSAAQEMADLDDAPAHSTTNVQVDGVDEGDIVKTDGNRIYYLRHDTVSVVEVDETGAMELIHNHAREDNMWGHYRELYVTADKLVVIGMFYHAGSTPSKTRDEDESLRSVDMDDWIYFPAYHTMTTVDIYDKASMEREETIHISGQLIGSRLIGDNLYLIGSHTHGRNDDDPRPYYYLNDERMTVDYEAIKYLPEMTTRAFTVISTIKLAEANAFEYDVFLGVSAWGQLYVNEQAIYMASNDYRATTSERDALDTDAFATHGTIIAYAFTDTGSVQYAGAGDYQGIIINQFAMDEHNGYFRIVTRDGWGADAINRLYVFERVIDEGVPRLEQRALLDEGIGKPEETVRSVRFQGDVVTVVTFEEIDPFYVIDLSDPTNPTILGELDMPGFSTYQHPWKNDTVIGIGYETDNAGFIIGLKLSLLDISDHENPTEIGQPLVLLNETQGWQYGEALHNHKAMLIAEPFNFIGFSIGRATWGQHYEYHSDYLIFDIDIHRDQPIEIGATISHMALFNEAQTTRWYYTFDVNRAITINNQLYVLSDGAISRHAMDDGFSLIDAIGFDED